jgi:RNA polymerase sigma-70 factor, ECF subfamily
MTSTLLEPAPPVMTSPKPVAAPRVLAPERLPDHVDRLFRAAYALTGSREDAEDLVQETYARVLARPRILRSDNDLAYLLRVLRNTFFASRKRSGRQPHVSLDDVAEPEAPRACEPDAALNARQAMRAVAELPADFRDALVAVDIVGLSYREAAHSLQVREGTVMSRLYRARERVARKLT